MRCNVLYLSCPPRSARPLVDELMEELAVAHIQARVLKYGATTKAHDGFMLIVSPQDFPRTFVERLQQDAEITDYVLCSDDEPGSISAAETEVEA